MKKYLLGLFAVALAIGFSAFTVSKKHMSSANEIYLSYNQQGSQAVIDNWSELPETPQDPCPNDARVCFIAVEDTDVSGTIDQSELNAFFATYDVLTVDGDLDNEVETSFILEKQGL